MTEKAHLSILVTGASGFVGRSLCPALETAGYAVRAVGRDVVGDISPATDWTPHLDGVDTVIHLAARAHVMSDIAAEPLEAYRHVNTGGTLNLARQAAAHGVRRMIFISSIKVNGEQTSPGRPFTAHDTPAPNDPYGVSKLEAESGLRALAAEAPLEVVIIRPPLVYGPGVKANFLSMMRWLDRGIPLPLGAVNNRRSMVNVDNLVDLIITCIHHPAAAGQVFLASDGEDLSTTALLRRLGAALGKQARLIPVPTQVIAFAARLLGRQAITQRLFGSLQVDSSLAQTLLNWQPLVSVDEGLRRTAAHFLTARHNKNTQ